MGTDGFSTHDTTAASVSAFTMLMICTNSVFILGQNSRCYNQRVNNISYTCRECCNDVVFILASGSSVSLITSAECG